MEIRFNRDDSIAITNNLADRCALRGVTNTSDLEESEIGDVIEDYVRDELRLDHDQLDDLIDDFLNIEI